MTFRTKTKNKFLVEERQTLDAKHNGILSLFTENKERLPELESQLKNIETELASLKELNTNKLVIDMELQRKIWKLDDDRAELMHNIDNIKNNTDENKYMLNTGKIISNYYKIIEKEKEFASVSNYNRINENNDFFQVASNENNTDQNQNQNLITNEFTHNKKKNIMDWFSKSDNNAPFENIDTGKKTFKIIKKNIPTAKKLKESNIEANNSSSNTSSSNTSSSLDIKDGIINTTNITNNTNNTVPNNVSNNLNSKKLLNKDEIYEKYMKVVDKNYILVNNDDVPIFDKCSLCHVEMLLNNNTGILICPNCGATENIIIDSDKPSFKEPPKEMTSFCYKRINHLNEFLAQFQAKETTDIPEDVYNEILVEIKKERITNMAHITPDKMRIILKKIKKNDYYEHIPYIINQLNGLPAPVIAPEIEEIIRGMFKAIQIPFEKYCPHKRKNFLSYNYVMYKFFELLELDEYLDCFQLLKSRTKLHQQDLIWKNICLDLNWQFIKSL
jgi:hypothetical protein